MKIALPTKTSGEKSFIADQFGRANYFYIYDSETSIGEVYINQFKDDQGGVGLKVSEMLLNKGMDILIAPRVGEKALRLLRESGVRIYLNTDKIVKENLASYFNGELKELL